MILKNSLRDLAEPLTGKPALTCSLVLMALYGSLDCPEFAAFLLVPVAACIFAFPRSVQLAILFTLLGGLASHHIFKPATIDYSETPAVKACGSIEAVLPRGNGTAFIIAGPAGKVRLTEKRDLPQLPEPGDSICYEASWYPVTPPTVPGAFDTQHWLQGLGMIGYGKFLHWESHPGKWIPERSFFQFRKWIKSRFDDYLDPSETGFLLGLLAGDRSGIPDALRSDFQRSGLVHVLAISGFHVVLLAGMLMVFLKATRLPHKAVRIIAVLLLFIYIPITGNSPAVRRAVLMFAVPQLGALMQRPANTLNSLGVALLFILIPHPEELWNPGFQLSVAATAGILIGGKYNPMKHIPECLRHSKIWGVVQGFCIEPTYVTLCATLATAPFLIHHFKTLSPFAWLGNIVVVPAVSMGMQAGLFALLSPIDFLRQHFCYAAGFFLRLASLLTRLLSSSSEASVTVGPFGPMVLLLLGGLFALFPVMKRNTIARTYGILSILLFSIFFCISGYRNVLYPSWTLTAIDIGQGDSILLTTPAGHHILVDTGDNSRTDSGKDIIVPYLHYIGVLQLDALVITHPDKDHFGGSESILKMFPVKELWLTTCALQEDKEEWQAVLDEASDRKVPIREIHRGFVWKENRFEIEAIHPDRLLADDTENSSQKNSCGDLNEGSITLRARGLGHSAILTGDLTAAGEKQILREGTYLKSDVLKLGHHGSKTSSSRPFLEAVAPGLALISSGRRNKFHHPHKQVTDRLDSLQIPYLNTATRGTIDVQFLEDTILVRTMLE